MPVTLKLLRAPILSKQEIADSFYIPHSNFEIVHTNDRDGECSYFLEVKTTETAVKMLTQFSKNRVFSFL